MCVSMLSLYSLESKGHFQNKTSKFDGVSVSKRAEYLSMRGMKAPISWLSKALHCLDSCPTLAHQEFACVARQCFLPASPTSVSLLKRLPQAFPGIAEHLDHHTTDCLQSRYLLFSRTFPGGEEALRCWTAYVYALNLPKWGRIKWLWLC